MFRIEPTMIDLGDTLIENIFLHDFLPMAPGDYIKVYLLGYQYVKEPNKTYSLDHEAMARKLAMTVEELMEAWRYWEKLGIIAIDEGEEQPTITYISLKQLYITQHLMQNHYEPSAPVVELVRANEDRTINEMFNNIDYMMRRPLVPLERQQVLDWIKRYNMTPEVIEEAVHIASEKKRRVNLNYVEGIIRRWYDRGMTNKEAMMKGLEEEGEASVRYRKVMDMMGLGYRAITDSDKRVIDQWFEGYGFDWDMITLASGELYKSSQPSVGYMEGILSRWHKEGWQKPEDVKPRETKAKETKKNTPVKGKKTGFHNFQERDDAALEALLRERRNWDIKP